ncbi:short transient receptor potential channel 5-like isoform X1 [Styela clava]
MFRKPTQRWNMDVPSNSFQHRNSVLNFTRKGSMRLHGFQQKRALKRGGLKSIEMLYLKFAGQGDVQMVEKLFKKYSEEQLNRNCTDFFDRTALVLAITNRHEDMIKCLLSNGVDLTESLFYAIENEFTEAVEYILNSDTAKQTRHVEMLVTSEESIFPRFLSPIMLAAHKNNYDILEILYNHGHRLRDLSASASNKWDEIRLRWLYYKARASQAYMIIMYNKEKVDPLNEAIEFYGTLKREGLKAREVRESYRELAQQCEEFAMALLDQIRTAQELADLLRFTLVGREHGNTNQLAFSTLPMLIAPNPTSEETLEIHAIFGSRDTVSDLPSESNWPSPSHQSPSIRINDNNTLNRQAERIKSRPAELSPDAADVIRSITNTALTTAPKSERHMLPAADNLANNEPDQRRISQVMDYVPEERHRTLGIRRPISASLNVEYARPIHFLKPIEKAVDNGMVRLVTCENSQLALTYLKDGILFRDATPKKCLLQKCLVGIMFPIISIAFYFFPNTRLGLVARNPTAKLWMEVASDIYLIILLIINLILSQVRVIKVDDFSPILIIAYFWMPGKFINLMFLTYHQGKRVLFSIWNWNDFATISLYTVFMILRIYGYTISDSTDISKMQWDPIPLSDMMISAVYILVFLRPLEILRVNRTFGPLQVSVDRMIGDVSKFFLLFLVIWFAFSSGINTLYWRYSGQSDGFHNCTMDKNNKSSKEDIHCCFSEEGTQKFTTIVSSLQVCFWSIFGYSDDYNRWFNLTCADESAKKEITAVFGETVFALYHIGTVLILVNMLIAIMSGTLQKTIDDSDIQWQFHRTRVWIRFIRTGFYRPPPMNLIPRPKEFVYLGSFIIKGFRKLCRCILCRSTEDVSRHPERAYQANIPMNQYGRRNDAKAHHKAGMLQKNGSPESRASGEGYKEHWSPGSAATEEKYSRYDVTLRKCVRRYLKANGVHPDDQQTANI